MVGQMVGTLAAVRRYPVKSMLGEDLDEAVLTAAGVERDRGMALLDLDTGRVATAKHPRLWRRLLQFSARCDGPEVVIGLPDGTSVAAGDADVDRRLSAALGRRVHLSGERPPAAAVERPAPEDVLAEGVDADVPFATLEIGRGTAGSNFVDYAPVHLIAAATATYIDTEAVRYRPNLVIDTTSTEPFAENDWVGHEINIGGVRLRAVLPTPRCAVPTLEHGAMPRAPHAVRTVLAENRIDVPGFGLLACAGLYAEVVTGGTVRVGDPVRLGR